MRIAVLVGTVMLAASVWAETVIKEDAGLRYKVGTDWVRVPAPSDMRAAQYRVPGADGTEGKDAELVIFFFGEGQGGDAEANLERWYGQFTQPDGSASRDKAVVTIRTVNDLKVTAVDLSGTYTAMRPGGVSQPATDQRMLAAVVEGEGGPWFVRLVGPVETVEQARAKFDDLLRSLESHR
jgi:hypothetical protein